MIETNKFFFQKQSIIYVIGSIAQASLPFLLIPLLTERMTPKEYGEYSLIYLTASLFGGIFYLGMTSSLSRFYFEYESKYERKAIYTSSFILILIGAGLQISISILFGKYISFFLFNDFIHNKQIFWAFSYNSLNFLILHFVSYLRLKRYALKSVFFSLLIPILSILLIQLTTSIHADNDIILDTYRTLALSNLIVFIFTVINLLNEFRFNKLIFLNEYKPLLKFGLGSVFFAFSQYFFDLQDKLIVEKAVGLEVFGIYAAVSRLAFLSNVILVTPFTFIWNPIMMEFRTKENVQRIFRVASNIYISISCFLLIPIYIFSDNVLKFSIKSNLIPLSDLEIPFLILSSGVLVYGYINIVSAGFLYSRKVYLISFLLIPLLIFKFILVNQFIEKFGLNGAAFASLLSYILLIFLIHFYSKRYFNFKINFTVLIKVILYTLIILPLISIIKHHYNNFIFDSLFSSLLIYLGFSFVYNSFNPRKLYSNIIEF